MWTWLLLVIAIVLEVCGTTSMKLSHGFTKWLPSVLMFIFYGFSFAAMTIVLRRLEVSVIYAIWAGAGTALIAIIGILWFRESLTPLKAISLVCVIIGVIGLNLSGGH